MRQRRINKLSISVLPLAVSTSARPLGADGETGGHPLLVSQEATCCEASQRHGPLPNLMAGN